MGALLPKHTQPLNVPMPTMGEVKYAPGKPQGTPWHPHRGFKTVPYMIDREMQHPDHLGARDDSSGSTASAAVPAE